ncbi:MAG: ABC transporter permease [Caulobacteraceae bacterium]
MSAWRGGRIVAWPFAGVHLPLAEAVAEALGNLRAQGQRSILALLGILIGTASIVAMLTIGRMAEEQTLKMFRHLGVDMLQIHAMPAGNAPAGRLDRARIEGLPTSDPTVLAATAMIVDRDDVQAGGKTAETPIAAVTPTFARLVRVALLDGRFIGPIDDDSPVAVVGSATAAKLSAPGAPLVPGVKIAVKGYLYTVIGILGPAPHTALDPVEINEAVLLPLTGAARAFTPADPQTALIHLRPGTDIKAAGQRIVAALANPTSTLQVISARDLIKGMNAQAAVHGRLLIAVGAISLLVGGIGVMNVMLMGVIERRREIGLRAAMGATPGDIALMFLVEAATLAFVGGLAGLACGLLAALVTARSTGWGFVLVPWVLPMGPAVAALVGIGFGLWPAIKAARLSPIEALRAD